jgi:hypothetical protein
MPARSVPVSFLAVALILLGTSRSTAAPSLEGGANAGEAVRCSDRLDTMQRAHERALLEIQGRLDDRTAELAALRRSCKSSPIAPHVASALTPLAPGAGALLASAPTTAMTSQETSETPQAAQRRRLLASDSRARPCSKAEMRTVLETPPSSPELRADAVKQILATNVECGLCILEFTSSPVLPDIIFDLQSCLHQDENMCDVKLGLSGIASLIPLASLHDRDSLVRMVELVEAGAFLHRICH